MLLKFEAEEFLYYEADLLDSRRFDEWLNLLADDIILDATQANHPGEGSGKRIHGAWWHGAVRR